MVEDDMDGMEIAPLDVNIPIEAEKPVIPIAEREDEPPDGGTRAWLQVMGSILMFFNVWGFTFAFGSFQNFYEITYIPGISPSAISWIGSIQTCSLITLGVITGQLFDRGYFQSLMFAGAFLSTFSVMMLSLSTKFHQIILSQGLGVGLGCGMLFTPSMALVARSFRKQRAIAMGVMACGAPTGGILYTLMFSQLLPKLGFPWTVRAMGLIMATLYLLSFPLLLYRCTNLGDVSHPGTRRKLFDSDAFTDLPFWAYAIATSLTFLGYLVPFFFMPSFAVVQLGTSQSTALYALITSQAASIPGRLVISQAAHRYGVMLAWSACALASAISCLAWAGVNTVGGFIGFCALYGFLSGPLIPLPTSIFPIVCPDPKLLGARLGMAQLFSAAANLMGPPIAGALVNARRKSVREDRHHFLGAQLWAGVVLLAGAGVVVVLWVILVRRRGTKVMI